MRIHTEWHIIRRRRREAESFGVTVNETFRKRKPFDCGKARCGVCRRDPNDKPTKRSAVETLRGEEMLREYGLA